MNRNLNTAQFPKIGETRDLGGVPHRFVGFHLTNQHDFAPQAGHETHHGMGERSKSDHLYVTADPKGWSGILGSRSYAAEVWHANEEPRIPKFLGAVNHEQTVPVSGARVGAIHPADSVQSYEENWKPEWRKERYW